jgi:hypothetical protein
VSDIKNLPGEVKIIELFATARSIKRFDWEMPLKAVALGDVVNRVLFSEPALSSPVSVIVAVWTTHPHFSSATT